MVRWKTLRAPLLQHRSRAVAAPSPRRSGLAPEWGPAQPPASRRIGTNAAAVSRWLRENAAEILVIGGYVWKRCGEPRYIVQTFGLGHNHGGTAMSVTEGFNPNIAGRHYFRADEFNKAEAHLQLVAAARGDTTSVSSITPRNHIQVQIPRAMRMRHSRQRGCAFVAGLETLIAGTRSHWGAGALVLAATALKLRRSSS